MNVSSITGIAATPPAPTISTGESGQAGPFARIVDQVLQSANSSHLEADQAVRQLAMGQTDNVHNVLLAVAKADLTFRMVLEIRNKLTEALQEIMRMQV